MTVKKYRKKPVVVEAIQFLDAWSADQIIDWAGVDTVRKNVNPGTGVTQSLMIETLEGPMRASRGDFIIKGTRGELYPCKPGPFEDTFEEVVDDDN